MDSTGGFHLEEKDDKPFLIYHHPKYRPIPQTQTPTSSAEANSHDHPLQPLFLCPYVRRQNHGHTYGSTTYPLNCPPEYVLSTIRNDDHHVLPLFWCNNKEFDADGGCKVCYGSNFGTDYYFCDRCDKIYHKECVESPLNIKHPYHPEHFLQLYFHIPNPIIECLCCGREAIYMVYHCTICKVSMHPICAMKSILFVIDQPKRHDHPITFFPRQTSLTCNVCGLLRKLYPTYVCLRCNFVAHNDCMYSPRIIKISRHHHRIFYVSSLSSGEWSCGVCRQSIDGDYGAYTCDKCCDYAVHSRCALGKDVCDGQELEGVPEEDDITQDDGPFRIISEGVIHYFLHDHHLRLKGFIHFDENKLCQACVLPIYEGNFFSCMECDFILHETCANAPRRIQHPLHSHPLTLKCKKVGGYDVGYFICFACGHVCGGFVYQCPKKGCKFYMDLRCASISEPLDYQGHEHPLFLALNPKEKLICHVCKTECRKQLNCIKCDFVVCFKCAILPYKVRYNHDKHFLTVLWGKEVSEKDWCEVCECTLKDTSTKVFYGCNECCSSIHIECLFGETPYLKPGQSIILAEMEVEVLRKSNLSRPFCDFCKNRCKDKRFTSDNRLACSLKCGYAHF